MQRFGDLSPQGEDTLPRTVPQVTRFPSPETYVGYIKRLKVN